MLNLIKLRIKENKEIKVKKIIKKMSAYFYQHVKKTEAQAKKKDFLIKKTV